MDFRFLDSSKEEVGIINNDQIHDAKKRPDLSRDEEIFTILMPYTDKNWLKVRNAVHFHVVENPEFLIKIRMISIQHDSLLITGYIKNEEVIEWMR